MHHKKIYFCALALLITAFATNATTLTPQQALHPFRTVSELTFSPDGTHLACAVSEFPKGDSHEAHIWLLDVRTGEFRQFTFSVKSERAPRWSPDGRTLAFISNRDARNQIYTISLEGGEAHAVTTGKNAVASFEWSPDGKRLGFLAAEPKSDAEEKKEKDKEDARVYDRERDLARFWTIDLDGKNLKQITRGAWKIEDFQWLTPDRIVTIANNRPFAELWTQAIYTVSLSDGQFTLFGKPPGPLGKLSASPGGKFIAFEAARKDDPHPNDLYVTPADSYSPRDVTASIDRHISDVKWQNDSTPIASVQDGFRLRLHRLDPAGHTTPIALPASLSNFDVARDGTLAFVSSSFDQPPQLWLTPVSGAPRQVSHLRPEDTSVTFARPEIFHYKSFDGREIEAALFKPTNVVAGAKLPLILYVHGGPAGAFHEQYYPWAQLLLARGYAVVMPNPRGSVGYGEAFLQANRADWGGGDFKDVMAAVDAILAQGETDPNRLGICGWSYGGYMSEWAITQTNRFTAAVSGAGMFDLAAEFGTEQGTEDDEWYWGTPWERPEGFVKSSPMTYIKNAKTPTLILQGENDPVDPIGQSTALYRALKRYNVQTELVVYPREPHGPTEEKHQMDILTRMVSWFDKYVSSNPSSEAATKAR